MADAIQRVSSTPLSSSPRSTPALSRPHWPWSTYTHRSSQSHLPLASQSAEPRTSSYIPAHHTGSTTAMNSSQDDTARHWSFSGFEWLIRDVVRLKDIVENGVLTENQDEFEILRESPMLGDGGKFKLEIAQTPLPDNSNESTPRTLSIYLTSLMVDYARSDYESTASIMVAIKCQSDRVGERGARVQWAWECWHDWSFRQGQEVWECPLPPISQLLQNTRIAATDSFVLCIQIHCPTGPFIPQQPSAYYVPRDLLDGLEASLDNANTGDVQFVCLERLNPDAVDSVMNASPTLSTASFDHRSSSGKLPSFHSDTTARKRTIYAHSDILIRRSDYFATMLNSSFSENLAVTSDGRKMFVIVVEEADFETIYWLLKYCYANWVLFKEANDDDPRVAVESVGAGWSVHSLNNNGRSGEWDWKTFRKPSSGDEGTVTDSRSATSGDGSGPKVSEGAKPKATPERGNISSVSTLRPSIGRTAPGSSKPSTATTPSRPTPSTNTASSRRPSNNVTSNEPSTLALGVIGSSQPKSAPIPISIPNNYPKSGQFHLSPRAGQRPAISSPDPHPHPTVQPSPASALSMYQLAHRYAMPGLAALALEHMMSTITPDSSFALLLATAVWEELHSLIEDYVVEKWELVSASSQFEQCCEEISAGEWGSEGGKTLMTLFRRLRSPNAVYPRS